MGPEEYPANTALLREVREFLRDFQDLVNREIRLLKRETTTKLVAMAGGGAMMAAAGLVAFLAVVMLLLAIVFGLAALGLGVDWSFLIVAVVLGIAAAGLFFTGRSQLEQGIVPDRSLRQLRATVQNAKEQMQ